MRVSFLHILLPVVFVCSCRAAEPCPGGDRIFPVIPCPEKVRLHHGFFNAEDASWWIAPGVDSLGREAIQRLWGDRGCMAGCRKDASVIFELDRRIPFEHYRLSVDHDGISVKAPELHGFIYAVQTLRQLLPAVPCCTVEDGPRFSYRGMHLDVSRHFFTVEEVKRYIDILELHKLNVLHLHLTDDQGWRLEIKKYPLLVQEGSAGQYYSGEDIREIVQYAQARGITVIPEIDMPGHMLGALAAYPHLGCTGGPYAIWNGRWGISDDVLCPGKETTYSFVKGVLDEVMELFPSQYIHIGGDECPKVRWESCADCSAMAAALALEDDGEFTAGQYLQSYFMQQVQDYLALHGRKAIGWDEILEGGVSDGVTVMSWRGTEGGIKAAESGHDAIMTPWQNMYFDYRQGTDDGEPGAGRYLPIEQVYSYEPVPDSLTADVARHIIGVQANLWTEHVHDGKTLEYMLLPRLAALSEVQWCGRDAKDYRRFLGNLDRMLEMYGESGYGYCPAVRGVTASVHKSGHSFMVDLSTAGDVPVYYTLDGSEPYAVADRPDNAVAGDDAVTEGWHEYVPADMALLYDAPVEISHGCTFRAAVLRDGKPLGTEIVFREHKAFGKDVILNIPPHPSYSSNALEGLTDGIHGDAHTVASGKWSGWQSPVDVTIDMGESHERYSRVEISYYVDKPGHYFGPSDLSVSLSDDGVSFEEVACVEYEAEGQDVPDGIRTYALDFPGTDARYVRVRSCNPVLPEWHPAAGFYAFLIVDEIVVL
ncbi:MAG: glycoside hydrolase family 20 protein [Bacteroidales bacterium]|nr:glycoside hydrolase family 20 protein [Bacteroidales bacterium]